MVSALRAGTAYFLLVFAAGFALGTLRTTVVAPALGALAAVGLELPVILAVSWFACRWTLRRIAVSPALPARLLMGGSALALLLVAEAGVSLALAGLSFAEHIALYRTMPVLAGLLGQIAFALFPSLQLRSVGR